jgi:quinoprotein glucose dehydrogenase
MLWMHSENEGKRGESAPRQLSGRGLSYWSDGKGDDRIVYVTPGYRMLALNAKTGVPVPSFGKGGVVDLKTEADQVMDLETGEIGLHATPIIAKDVIVVGAAHLPGGSPRSKSNQKGYVRGYDARTGKRLWIFHTLPRPGEEGNETWEKDSWSYTGNTGVWSQMTIDEELNTVFLPVELPTGDYYGGNRPGSNLFGETLVALDLRTGRRKWHYQLVHHGLWDMDIPCAPILADINVNGRLIKAVIQPTKQGWHYVFDRTNGQPVWPIEERPVPAGDVPNEWYAPTQPFVTKPVPFERQGVSVDDLIDFTPELRQQALDIVKNYKLGPMFTPPIVSKWPDQLATLMLPSATGGANWQGASLDPETNIIYIFTNTSITALGLVPQDPARGDFGWANGQARNPNATPPAAGGGGGGGGEGGGPGLNIQGLPIVKPPYGRITAIDLDDGSMVWQIPHGDTADNIKNHPLLKGVKLTATTMDGKTHDRLGRQGRLGVLTTKTLLVAGEGGFVTTPSGRGAMLRAYDKATGQDAGAVYMPAPQTGSPMTYMMNGRQYIAVAIGGNGFPAELITYRVPQS